MTIKDFAKKRGISTQAIYQRLKLIDRPLDQVRVASTGELTAEGEALLVDLYSKQKPTKKTLVDSQFNELKAEAEAIKIDRDGVQAQVEALQTALASMTAERDAWQRAAEDNARRIDEAHQLTEQAQRIADQAQKLNVANLQALPAPKLSLWSWLTGRRNDQKSDHSGTGK